MTNLFIKPEDEIVVFFSVAIDSNGKIYSSPNKNALKNMFKDEKCEIKEYTATFKKPSFKDVVELNKSIVTASGTGGLSFNPTAERYHKMIKLIKKWTLTNEKGEIIEPTETTIGQLSPGVADTIASLLEIEIGSTY